MSIKFAWYQIQVGSKWNLATLLEKILHFLYPILGFTVVCSAGLVESPIDKQKMGIWSCGMILA